MIYVALNNIRINGFHGAYPEEKILGNEFVVNIKAGSHNEEYFMDYVELKNSVQVAFSEPKEYLEEIQLIIETRLRARWPELNYLMISIKKMNPPMDARVESSEVILERSY